MSSKIVELTKSRLLVKNVLLTFAAQALPLLIALFAIPLIIKYLNVERFGLLSLCWAILGYLTFFDLGIGRAITKLIAEKLALEQYNEIGSLFWPSFLLLLLLSLIGAVLLAFLTPFMVVSWFNIPNHLHEEAITSLYIVALGLPLITSISAFRGTLEAAQRFDFANGLHLLWGSLNFLSPVLAIPIGANVINTLIILMIGRCFILALSIWFAFKAIPQMKQVFSFNLDNFKRVLRFGSWMTVSNLISPLMVYLDRFVIGWISSVAILAYYVTPYEMITRLLIIPTAIIQVFFPALSATLVGDLKRSLALYEKIGRIMMIAMTPLLLIIIIMAYELLQMWLGTEFASKSTILLQIMSYGILTNSFARLPFTLLHASDKTHWTAFIHLIELPLFLLLLWYATSVGGTTGTAIATALRFSVDLALMMFAAQRTLSITHNIHKLMIQFLILFTMLTVPALFISSFGIRLTFLNFSLLIYALFCWKYLLSSGEKEFIRGLPLISRIS